MATPINARDSIDFLYPDLLSKEGLLHILKNRYVQIPSQDLESLEKEALVELYNKFILPRPQRKYRDNLRGKEMKQKQMSRDRKRKIPLAEDFDSGSAKKKGRLAESSPTGPSRGLVNHFQSPVSGGSRLKPPPSCIDTSKKVVRLSSSPSSTPLPVSPTGKEEGGKGASSPVGTGSKVVKLTVAGGTAPNGPAKQPASESKEDDGKSPPKKKFSKITWP